MDGGVDAAITGYFGSSLQRAVQQRVLKDFEGEQPVGTSFVIAAPMPRGRHRFIAHTPTMVLTSFLLALTSLACSLFNSRN